jgi:hypothetical protein
MERKRNVQVCGMCGRKGKGGKYLTNAFVPIEGDKVFLIFLFRFSLSNIFSLVI